MDENQTSSALQPVRNAPLVCPTLPSSESAYNLVTNPSIGTALVVGRDTLVRGALIAIGMYIAGERKHLVRNALGGAIAIEAFVLAYTWAKTKSPQLPSTVIPAQTGQQLQQAA